MVLCSAVWCSVVYCGAVWILWSTRANFSVVLVGVLNCGVACYIMVKYSVECIVSLVVCTML